MQKSVHRWFLSSVSKLTSTHRTACHHCVCSTLLVCQGVHMCTQKEVLRHVRLDSGSCSLEAERTSCCRKLFGQPDLLFQINSVDFAYMARNLAEICAQLLMLQGRQSSRVVNKATPRFVQCAADMLDGNRTSMTKLVLCPVVLKIPRRSLVLYMGHR